MALTSTMPPTPSDTHKHTHTAHVAVVCLQPSAGLQHSTPSSLILFRRPWLCGSCLESWHDGANDRWRRTGRSPSNLSTWLWLERKQKQSSKDSIFNLWSMLPDLQAVANNIGIKNLPVFLRNSMFWLIFNADNKCWLISPNIISAPRQKG